MQEKPPAVHHPAVKGHFSWVLPQEMWLMGLEWRAVAHKCASCLYSSLVKVLQCTEMSIQDSSSFLWILFKTNRLNTESLEYLVLQLRLGKPNVILFMLQSPVQTKSFLRLRSCHSRNYLEKDSSTTSTPVLHKRNGNIRKSFFFDVEYAATFLLLK